MSLYYKKKPIIKERDKLKSRMKFAHLFRDRK